MAGTGKYIPTLGDMYPGSDSEAYATTSHSEAVTVSGVYEFTDAGPVYYPVNIDSDTNIFSLVENIELTPEELDKYRLESISDIITAFGIYEFENSGFAYYPSDGSLLSVPMLGEIYKG